MQSKERTWELISFPQIVLFPKTSHLSLVGCCGVVDSYLSFSVSKFQFSCLSHRPKSGVTPFSGLLIVSTRWKLQSTNRVNQAKGYLLLEGPFKPMPNNGMILCFKAPACETLFFFFFFFLLLLLLNVWEVLILNFGVWVERELHPEGWVLSKKLFWRRELFLLSLPFGKTWLAMLTFNPDRSQHEP